MKYLLISDIHGSPEVMAGLFNLLEDRGWSLRISSTGHPYLHHDEEKLTFVGDNSDRGLWSLSMAYLALSSMVTPAHDEVEGSTFTLMGNHDLKIYRYLVKNYKNPGYGFSTTLSQLESSCYSDIKAFMREYIEEVPYWYLGKTFVAVHAYWKNPAPSEELAIYGPVIKSEGEGSRGYMPRIHWWEQANTTGRFIFFGHYHMKGEGLGLGNNVMCLDNHDGGVHVAAEIDDDTGKVLIHHLDVDAPSVMLYKFLRLVMP
jgi:hypothetical protein